MTFPPTLTIMFIESVVLDELETLVLPLLSSTAAIAESYAISLIC